jgi:hypothetical protein
MLAVYVPRIAARHSEPGGPATPTERAYGAGCEEYLGQINQAITMYKDDHDGAGPSSFDDLKQYGIGDEIVHAEGCSFTMQDGVAEETAHGTAPTYQPAAQSGYQQLPQGGQQGYAPNQGGQTPPGAGASPGGSTLYGVHIPAGVLGGGSDTGGAGGN